MFHFLKSRFGALFAAIKSRYNTRFRRGKVPSRGYWTTGEHREADGALTLAPFISTKRGYRFYVPARHASDAKLPLLVMLHGCNQDAKTHAAGAQITELADNKGIMLLYPEQLRLANLYRCWNWFDPSSQTGKGEAAIIAGMVRSLITTQNIDPARIYVAGISAGGALASVLASCYADLFAACAVHSGLMFQAARSALVASDVMRHGSHREPEHAAQDAFAISTHKVDCAPMMVIHGDQDRTVDSINAQQIVMQFTALNRLIAAVKHSDFDETPREKTFAPVGEQYGYSIVEIGNIAQPIIRQVKVHGMAHAWSGGSARYPYNDPRGPNASQMMLDFFALHRREKRHEISLSKEEGEPICGSP